MAHYEPNLSLCVLPKGTESQYEAFQSVFAAIMFAYYPPIPGNNPTSSAYESLCYGLGVHLVAMPGQGVPTVSPGQKVVFFKATGTTHYKAITEAGAVIDPYVALQAKGTQGFCQMFALLCAIGHTGGLVQVDQTRKIDGENFKKLIWNNQICFIRAMELLNGNTDAVGKFIQAFDILKTDPKYGIKPGTTAQKYMEDFSKINQSLRSIAFYVYDQPLEGWRPKVGKQELWDLIQDEIKGGKRYKLKLKK